MDLSIVIVSYNTRNILRQCLQSITEHVHDLVYEIIVVDNASGDGSVAMVQQEFPAVKIQANTNNEGFARANNQGIALATGEYVLLLNSDTIILDNGLKTLIESAHRQPRAGVIGCKILNRDRSLQFSCAHFPSFISELIFFTKTIILDFWDPWSHYKFMRYWSHNHAQTVDCLFGCFLLVKRTVFQEVGLLDEEFFMYYEDVEFCQRVKRSGRYRIVYDPSVAIIHLGGMSANPENHSMIRYAYKSVRYYLAKVYGRWAGRLFNIACKLIWRIQILVLAIFQSHPKCRKKLTMLQGFLAL